MSARPHCELPDACRAKGDGHCRRCIGLARAASCLADPAVRNASRKRITALNLDPQVRAQQVKSLQANKSFIGRLKRSARQRAKIMNTNPEIIARREAAKLAAMPRILETKALKLARVLGIPATLIGEYQDLKRRAHLSRDEAIGVIRSSYPQHFRELEAEQRAEKIRSLGPLPVAGTRARSDWMRSVYGTDVIRPKRLDAEAAAMGGAS